MSKQHTNEISTQDKGVCKPCTMGPRAVAREGASHKESLRQVMQGKLWQAV